MNKKYKFFIVVSVLFYAASGVNAASFDCTKAVTPVEKIICSNSDIEELDDKLTIIYSKAINNNAEQQSDLIAQQKYWLKQVRNLCKNVACLKEAYSSKITELKSYFKMPIDRYELTGIWYGSDTASRSIYGKIVITDHAVAWGGKGTGNPFCKTQYSIESEPFGISFKDQIEGTYVYNENSQFKTFKLKLAAQECINSRTYLRFTIPFYNPNYADVIEYEENDHASAYIHFQKFND